MAETPAPHRPPPQETLLLDLIQRLDRLRAGRVALHIHFSQLSTAYNQERYVRIAVDSFSIFVSGFEGHLFSLDNGDIFFLAKDVTVTLLEAIVDRIRLLFTQDPLLESYTIKGQSRFCSFYELDKDYPELQDAVAAIYKDAVKRTAERAAQAALPAPPVLVPVQPQVLSRLEHALTTVDVSNIARRQTVCTLIDDNNPQPLFEEIYVSITDLQNVVAPGINIASNTWLFRYLTQTLDHRVMQMLIRDGVTSVRPFSLNINVSTILTPEFARFEAIVAPQLRGRLVVELNKLDVFSDMGAFLFARDYLHDHGFRLCLDGLTHHTLSYYNREKLGFDLMKLSWTPGSLNDMLPSMIPEIRNLIMENGQAHTILCRCDDDRAVQVGRELGIVMFQGRRVDRLLAQARIPAPSRF